MEKENKYMQYQYVVAYLQEQVKRGVKQKDLAQAIGKSNTFVNYIVKDKRKNKYLHEEIIEKLANYFGSTIEQMMEAGKAIYHKNNPKDEVKHKHNSKITQIHLHIYFNGTDHVITA